MSKIYNGLVNTADRFVPNSMRPLWNHAAGKLLALFQGHFNFKNARSYGKRSFFRSCYITFRYFATLAGNSLFFWCRIVSSLLPQPCGLRTFVVLRFIVEVVYDPLGFHCELSISYRISTCSTKSFLDPMNV